MSKYVYKKRKNNKNTCTTEYRKELSPVVQVPDIIPKYSKYYAGIGARRTPKSIQLEMFKLASFLEKQDYCLRSGSATGADTAFESGVWGKAEIFLPWDGYNNKFIGSGDDWGYWIKAKRSREAYQLANKYHPNFDNLDPKVKQLMIRNVHIILGRDLQTPVDFVICWTKNGTLTGFDKDSGGTGMALRLAKDVKIKIYNLKIPFTINKLKLELEHE